VPFLGEAAAVPDPPIKVVGVEFLVVEGALRVVVAHRCQVQPGKNSVHWVPHDDNDLVGVEGGCLDHDPGRVRLDNPNGIIGYVLTFHSLHLETNVEVQGVVGAGLDASEELHVPP
jgi:hypothetical protein